MSKDYQEISDFLPADFLESPYVRLQYDRYGDDSLTAPPATFHLRTLSPPGYQSSPTQKKAF